MNETLNISLNDHKTARAVIWLLPACALLVAGGSLFSIRVSLTAALASTAPAGQFLYLLSKAAGLLAITQVWMHLMLSLSSRIFTPLAYAGQRLHRINGMVLLCLLFLHPSLIVAAVSVRQGALSLGMLVPGFSSGFYTASVSLGVLGLLLFGLASAVYVVRQNRARLFRWMHRGVIAACILVFAHSYLIGSETRSALVGSLYLASLVLLLTALVVVYLKPAIPGQGQHG